MTIIVQSSHHINPIHMNPGDKLVVSHTSLSGERNIMTYDIDEKVAIVDIDIVKIKDAMGFKNAIGCIMGTK